MLNDSETNVDKTSRIPSTSFNEGRTFQNREQPRGSVEASFLSTSESDVEGCGPEEQKRQLEDRDQNVTENIAEPYNGVQAGQYELQTVLQQFQDPEIESIKNYQSQTATKTSKDLKYSSCREKFQGFTTASGAKVLVSEKALLQARKTLIHADSEISVSGSYTLNNDASSPVSFSDRSKTVVSIGDDSVQSTAKWYGENDRKDHKTMNEDKTLTIPSDCSGFPDSSVSGHPDSVVCNSPDIRVSCCLNTKILASPAVVTPSCLSINCSGSQDTVTHGGQNVKRSENKITNVHSYVISSRESSSSPNKNVVPYKQALDDGECTCVTVSLNMSSCDSAHSEAKKKFCDKSLRVNNKDLLRDSESVRKDGTRLTNTPSGFSTASGLQVFISRNALKHATDFLNETEGAVSAKEVVPNISFGFSTASGSRVSVSEKALYHARSFLTDSEKDVNGIDKVPGRQSNVAAGMLCNTGHVKVCSDRKRSGSDLTLAISENLSEVGDTKATTFEVAKNYFEKISDMNSVGSDGETASVFGLSTMNDMKTTSCGKLVPHAENKLTDTDSSGDKMMVNNYHQLVALTSGFSTASGSKVYVSDVALRNAKDLLGDAENTLAVESATACASSFVVPSKNLQISDGHSKAAESFGVPTSSNISHSDVVNGGFSLASGSAVVISDKAMEQAQFSLEDVNVNRINDYSSSDDSGGLDGLTRNATQSTNLADFCADDSSVEKRSVNMARYNKLDLASERTSKQESAMDRGDGSSSSIEPKCGSGGRQNVSIELSTPVRSTCEKFHYDRQKTRGRSLSAVLSRPAGKSGVTPQSVTTQTMRTFKSPYKKTKIDDSDSVATTSNVSTTSSNNSKNATSRLSFVSPAPKLPSAPSVKFHHVMPDKKAPVFVHRKQQSYLKFRNSHPEDLVSTDLAGELEYVEENRLLCQDFDLERFPRTDDVTSSKETVKGTEQPLQPDPLARIDPTRLTADKCSFSGQKQIPLKPACDPNLLPDSHISDNVLTDLTIEEARMKQEKVIRNKKKCRVRPLCGRWFVSRKRKEALTKFLSLGMTPMTGLTKD